MQNYLFTLTVNIQYTVQFLYFIYLSKKLRIIC